MTTQLIESFQENINTFFTIYSLRLSSGVEVENPKNWNEGDFEF